MSMAAMPPATHTSYDMTGSWKVDALRAAKAMRTFKCGPAKP